MITIFKRLGQYDNDNLKFKQIVTIWWYNKDDDNGDNMIMMNLALAPGAEQVSLIMKCLTGWPTQSILCHLPGIDGDNEWWGRRTAGIYGI